MSRQAMHGLRASPILNDATSQLDRIRGAPAPEKFEVDGRSLAQLLAFAAGYGALICFYDLEDQPDGDWAAFFAADPAVACALHAALDLPEIETAMQALLKAARDADDHPGRLGPLRRLFAALARLLAILDRTWPAPGDGEVQVRSHRLHGHHDRLGDRLGRLQRHLSRHTLDDGLHHDFHGWGKTLIELVDDAVTELLAALSRGASDAALAMERSLESSGHAPSAAVYNAFVRLFVEQRRTLNQFPRRLVDFYYGDVLDQHGLAAKPDTLFLTFTLAKGVDQASVPRGALFSAGTDANGEAINYAAEAALEVTAATVEAISVHRVTYVPLRPHSDLEIPTGVLTGTVRIEQGGAGAMAPFPMFGAGEGGTHGSLEMEPAMLGFSVTSPTLMLAGGKRTIDIGLVLSLQNAILPFVDTLLGTAGAKGEKLPELLARGIESSFHLYYSTAGGWMAVEEFTVTPVRFSGDDQATLFSIRFELPADAPPLVALSTPPPKNAPPPTHPATAFPGQPESPAVVGALRLGGREESAVFAMLSTIRADSVSVDVEVEGLDELTLTNPNGVADIGQDFAPLGLAPKQFSALRIYAPELFAKTIDRISVSIEWAGLPVTSTGFQGYYQNYVINADGAAATSPLFDNGSFQVAFSVTNPGAWDVASTQQALFQTGPPVTMTAAACDAATPAPQPAPDLPVMRWSVLSVPGVTPLTVSPYYNPATSTLDLALVAPDYAFGNILYSSNLMAAAAAQSAAASASASGGSGAAPAGAAPQVANLAIVHAAAPDRSYPTSIKGAVHAAITALNGDALAAVHQAIAQSRASAETRSDWLYSLAQSLSAAAGNGGSLWGILTGGSDQVAEAIAVLDAMKGWVAAHGGELKSHAAPALARHHAIAAAASAIADAWTGSAGQPVAAARATMAAAVQQAQLAVQPTGLPNPPWQPMASALSVDYAASATLVLSSPGDGPPDSGASAAATCLSGDPAAVELDFWHIGPFGSLTPPVAPDSGNPGVLPHVQGDAALYIQLSAQVPQISLLFILSAGPDGWWDDPPKMVWEQYVGGRWVELTRLGDSTDGLRNSGIVTLALEACAGGKPRLRVRALAKTHNAPRVEAVIANAVTAHWVGPGGAEKLGSPLPAGTIKKAVDSLAGIASIDQPMQSFGGRPPATGRAFQKWMAERLRHKGFGIDAWDYARIALEAMPSLWQVAVVPAVDEQTGHSPGSVWLVAVAGRDTPNISDPTVPSVDLATLAEIGETLQAAISPFVELTVTNPPYLRLKVTAEISFCDENTPAYWIERLHDELVRWLSPWPDPTLGPRPRQYYTRRAVAEFIRRRAYVEGVDRIEIGPEGTPPKLGWYYLTSAQDHELSPAPARRDGSSSGCASTTAGA